MKWKQNKYHNKKVEWHGEQFDSIKERDRYIELLLMQRARMINNLSRQVHFELTPNTHVNGEFIRKSEYVADFTYWDKDGHFVVEDCKGFKTDTYILKKKMLLYRYGYLIKET